MDTASNSGRHSRSRVSGASSRAGGRSHHHSSSSKPSSRDAVSDFIPWLSSDPSKSSHSTHSEKSSSHLPSTGDVAKDLQRATDRIKRLEEKYDAKSAKLREVRGLADEEIAALQKKAQSLERVLAEATKREEESSAQVATMREKRDALRKEKDAMRKELAAAEEQAQKWKKERKAMADKERAMADELEALRNKVPANNKKTKQLEVDNARLKDEAAALKKANADLTKKNSSILAAIKKMEAERDAALDNSKQMTGELADQKKSIKSLRTEVRRLQVDREKFQQTMSGRWPHQRLWSGVVRFCWAIFPTRNK